MRILIVDDDKLRSEKLSRHLVDTGVVGEYGIETAFDIRAARELLRAKYYDALVLDVVLPKREGEGSPDPSNGVSLLSELARSPFLKKPERIIGITAHLESIGTFRSEFERCCSVVIPADGSSSSWRSQIGDAISYTVGSKIARQTSVKKTFMLSVHGIRTYGEWQNRLRSEVEKNTDQVEFLTYKYGYFSTFSLMIPALRNREVRRLCDHLKKFSADLEEGKVVVFAHSFGTYIVAEAMRVVLTDRSNVDITMVLCGSVLPETYDWSFVSGKNVSVVNECGISDVVLYLAKVFVPGLGMAGKVGFRGFNYAKFVNRYYAGGHSLYFNGECFFRNNWIPLIAESGSLAEWDERASPGIMDVFMDSVARIIGRVKGFAWIAFGFAILGFVAFLLLDSSLKK